MTRPQAGLATYCFYAFVACLAWALVPPLGFWVNDEALRFLQVSAINSTPLHGLAITFPCEAASQPGLVPLPSWIFRKFGEANYLLYPDYFPRLLALVSRMAGEAAMRAVPLLAGLLAVLPWRYAAAHASPRARTWLPVLVLASPFAFYHWLLWEHTLAFLLQTVSLWVFLGAGGRTAPLRLLVAGFILGTTTFLRMEMGLFAAAFVAAQVMASREVRRPGLFALGFAIPVAALIAVNQYRWGLPLGPHLLAVATGSETSHTSRPQVIRTLLVGNSEAPIAAAASFIVLVTSVWGVRTANRVLIWLLPATCLLAAVVARLFLPASPDPLRSLLDYGSITMLPPLLLAGFSRNPLRGGNVHLRVLAWTCWIFVVVMLAVCPAISSVGIHWGPRLMLPLLVPLAILAADRWEAMRLRARLFPALRPVYLMWIVILGIGLVDTLESFLLLRWQKAHSQAVEQALLARPERYLLSDSTWVAEYHTRVLSQDCVLVPREAADWKSALEVVRRAGATSYILATTRPLADLPGIQPLPIENRGIFTDRYFYQVGLQQEPGGKGGGPDWISRDSVPRQPSGSDKSDRSNLSDSSDR